METRKTFQFNLCLYCKEHPSKTPCGGSSEPPFQPHTLGLPASELELRAVVVPRHWALLSITEEVYVLCIEQPGSSDVLQYVTKA